MRLEFWHHLPRRLPLDRRKNAPPHIGPRMRLPQAKDVPEGVILELLRTEPKRWWTLSLPEYAMPSLRARSPELAALPERVVLAKLVSMRRRGLVDGCACGCRGDWHIPELFYGGNR